MRPAVRVLAQIRLNLTSIDQFLSSACSLADDNPQVRNRIYEAAKEARSAAHLIDHLRNLFSHQQAIESEQYELNLMHNQRQQSENALLFTYSNQLTLVRAAKCLVANVAKVLYLADSTVLQSDREQEQLNAQENLALHEKSVTSCRVSDRLDNVANYSQLLRSFGELSSEMVDLGHCIMLSNQVRDVLPRLHQDWLDVNSRLAAQYWPADGNPVVRDNRCDQFQEQQGRTCYSDSHQRYNLRHSGKGDFSPTLTASNQTTDANLNLIDDLSPSIGLSAQSRELANPLSQRSDDPLGLVQPEQRANLWQAGNDDDTSGNSNNNNINCNDKELIYGADAISESLKTQIQDMQILFQVNRLIIDRSILILLSASKCCLRQGSEYLSGLETRRSIVGQIRASISIIMAIVKCSIFSQGSQAAATTITLGVQQQATARNQPDQAQPVNLLSTGSVPSNCTANNQPTTATLWQPRHLSATNSSSISRRPQCVAAAFRDNQFDYRHCLAACQLGRGLMANAATLDDLQLAQTADYLPLNNNNNTSNTSGQPMQDLLVAEGANHHLPHGVGGAQGVGSTLSSSSSPLQIMNYFLQTWNNTRSAHDAINKLQLLVAPFERVANHNQLMETLGAAIKRHRHSSASAEQEAAQQPARQQYRWQRQSGPEKENNQPGAGLDYAQQHTSSAMSSNSLSLFLMNKRQLINALNSLFLGELKSSLVERAQEFTDCAYTKHEHRETIVQLIQCIKLLLNKLVKLLYRLQRRKAIAVEEQPNLGQLRQVAALLSETCAELDFELQAVVIEQSDELDKCNTQTELIKQMKHFCLLGDLAKSERICLHFLEQSEQLVELCKMLNQVSPTHKMKITTKSLALWFELNAAHLTDLVQCLAQNPRSRALKECAWAYIQVWCSFYDDFCQLARQIAYLTHAQSDTERQLRVANLRDQLLLRRCQQSNSLIYGADYPANLVAGSSLAPSEEQAIQLASLQHATSVQSLNMAEVLSDATNADSPRSLDHYYGFGNNYHQQRRRQQAGGSPEEQLRILRGDEDECCLTRQSASPRLCFDQQPRPASNYQVVSQQQQSYAPNHAQVPPDAYCPALQPAPPRRTVTISEPAPAIVPDPGRAPRQSRRPLQQVQFQQPLNSSPISAVQPPFAGKHRVTSPNVVAAPLGGQEQVLNGDEACVEEAGNGADQAAGVAASGGNNTDQQSSANEADKWSDSDADAIVRGAKETAQMALSMYQFTRGEGDLNTTQDLFTQAELFAEEANELYKEVRCFSYKVPAGELKKELLAQLGTIPALVQQLQFIVKNPTVGKPATFAKVDSVIRETRSLMEAVNRVVTATLSCRQHYNMAIASMRKRTRTLSPSYRGANGGFEFDDHTSGGRPSAMGSGRGPGGGGMGSEPDI